MIQLTDKHYIGEGEIRVCYEHPEDRNLCIKIPRPEVTREYTDKEISYYKKINKRDLSEYDYSFFSNFKREIETNLGLGQVFDLIRDETSGEISKTLEYYLNNKTLISEGALEQALLDLREQMTVHKIFTRDLRARNICCKINKDNSINLVIIDGIGHRDFLPFADYFSFFAKKKIERTFTRWNFNSIAEQREFLKRNSK